MGARKELAPRSRPRGDEYYTPPEVFEALGLTFDLDVCAPRGGIPWIPARRYYSMDDDGLAQPWQGRVWMNPPYSRPRLWAEKFIAHRHGITLINQGKSTWYLKLWAYADAMAMPFTNLVFVGGAVFPPLIFAAFGDECVDALHRVGVVRVRT